MAVLLDTPNSLWKFIWHIWSFIRRSHSRYLAYPLCGALVFAKRCCRKNRTPGKHTQTYVVMNSQNPRLIKWMHVALVGLVILFACLFFLLKVSKCVLRFIIWSTETTELTSPGDSDVQYFPLYQVWVKVILVQSSPTIVLSQGSHFSFFLWSHGNQKMEMFPQQWSSPVLERRTHPSCGSQWKRAVTWANNFDFAHRTAAVTTQRSDNPSNAEGEQLQNSFPHKEDTKSKQPQ